mmetsp:Transcript_10459/g.24391  ORF Transcript_10459/g.24391 Transcript_10459/m.24391 type:complete len:260 (+) Transcript_10459:77-856(+)
MPIPLRDCDHHLLAIFDEAELGVFTFDERDYLIHYETYHTDRFENGAPANNYNENLQRFEDRMIHVCCDRVIQAELRAGFNPYDPARQQQRSFPLICNSECALNILEFANWHDAYRWWSGMYAPYMTDDMFSYRHQSFPRHFSLIQVGHIVPVNGFLLSIPHPNWFIQVGHHSNLGPQLQISNSHQGATDMYSRRWDGEWFDSHDETTLMESRRTAHDNRMGNILLAMGRIRTYVWGEDWVADEPMAWGLRYFDQRPPP